MTRYRMIPTPAQEAVLRDHCAHARYVWNLAVSAALSAGDRLRVPGLTWRQQDRLRRLERKLARAKRGSGRRGRVRLAIARLRARGTDRRKDWAEKKTTEIMRRFDLIKVEDLRIKNMARSAKGTREAPGRVVKVNAAFTSQRCSACGRVDAKSRESQARFVCTAFGYACHADVNAARRMSTKQR